MRILIDPGTPTCSNMGDVAMLQVAIARLRSAWPDATISVLTDAPEMLARHCPGTRPASEAGRRAWCDGFRLPARIRARTPAPIRTTASDLQRRLRCRIPALFRGMHRGAAMAGSRRARAAACFLDSLAMADLHVICGQATLADVDRVRAMRLLDTADLAASLRLPVVMLGQALGPMDQDALLRRAAAVLPRFSLIAIREELTSLPVLRRVGVSLGRVALTGDDAVELAWRRRPAIGGTAIGVHLRMAPLAISEPSVLAAITTAIRAAAAELRVPLVPLPISHHRAGGAFDPMVLQRALGQYGRPADGGASLDTPEKVISAAGTCRIVVTGAYHAAVFALSQGVPAICLGSSPYYLAKFRGLTAMFGPGCRVLPSDGPDLADRLLAVIRDAWTAADALRDPLLHAAEEQVALGQAAFARATEAVSVAGSTPPAAALPAWAASRRARGPSACAPAGGAR